MKVIKMPKVGNSVKTCLLSKWYFKENDFVNEGDVLFSFETDKTQIEQKSEKSGYLRKILVNSNEEVDVFAPIALIGEKDEIILEKYLDTTKTKTDQKQVTKVEETLNNFEKDNFKTQHNLNFASPRAKKLANELNFDLENVSRKTGANNRIIEDDVLNTYQKNQNLNISDSNVEKIYDNNNEIQYSQIRQAIKKQMMTSVQTTAQVTMERTFDARVLLSLKKRLGLNFEEKITINDLLIYAISRVVVKFPLINSHSYENFYKTFDYVNLGFAVDRGEGLFVPVIKNAHEKSLVDISVETKKLINLVTENKIRQKHTQDGTITISNVGNTGIKMFTPILNIPQSTIIGIGAIINEVKHENGEFISFPTITLSLTFNHNTYDGYQGALFLDNLAKNLENIDLLFVK